MTTTASIAASLGLPAAPVLPALGADAGAEIPTYNFPSTLPADFTGSVATAPETKTLLLNSKMREQTEAQSTLQALGNAADLAKKSIEFYSGNLLSTNADVREQAVHKIMEQCMRIKPILPQMKLQEHTIERLQKEIPALRLSIDNWPNNAGLVGGYASHASHAPPITHISRNGGFIPRPHLAYLTQNQARPLYF